MSKMYYSFFFFYEKSVLPVKPCLIAEYNQLVICSLIYLKWFQIQTLDFSFVFVSLSVFWSFMSGTEVLPVTEIRKLADFQYIPDCLTTHQSIFSLVIFYRLKIIFFSYYTVLFLITTFMIQKLSHTYDQFWCSSFPQPFILSCLNYTLYITDTCQLQGPGSQKMCMGRDSYSTTYICVHTRTHHTTQE